MSHHFVPSLPGPAGIAGILALVLGLGIGGGSVPAHGQDCMRWVERLDVGSPGPQSRHAMAYDRDRGMTMLLSAGLTADLWQFDGVRWEKLAVDGPRPSDRLDAALAYDPVRKVLVLAGGFGRVGNRPLGDTWTFAVTGRAEGRWTRQGDLPGAGYRSGGQISESGGRAAHRMVFDGGLGGVVVFGGDAWVSVSQSDESDEGLYSSSSRLLWSGGDWRRDGHQVPIEFETELAALSDFAMAYDGIRRRVVVHGGRRTVFHAVSDGPVVLGYDGLSVVSTNGLKRLATRAGRLGHQMVHDTRRDRYVVFGGAVLKGGENPTGENQYETDLPYFEFDPRQAGYPHVVPTSPSSIPRARVGHAMVYDERRGVTVMVGGMSNPLDLLNDRSPGETWELRPLLAIFKDLPAVVESCLPTAQSAELSPPVLLSVEAGSPGGVTYTWRHQVGGVWIPKAPNSAPGLLLTGIGDFGTWDVVMSDQCGNSITSSPCLVKVLIPPAIRVNPSPQQVCPGDPVEARVVAGPDTLNRLLEEGFEGEPERPVRYQWFRLGAGASGSPTEVQGMGAVAGATGPVLRFESFQPSDNGYYRCRLSNDCGSQFTEPVAMTAGVWIRRHPVTVTNEVCSRVELSVLATGKGPLKYLWRRNGDPLPTNGVRVAGATGPALTFASLRYLDDAAYDCLVTDACNTVTSRVAGVGVVPNPPFLMVETNGPAGRQRAGMVYDSVRGVSVLFGGLGEGRSVMEAVRNDTWEYDGTNWVRRFPAASPSARVDFGMAFDRHRGRVVLFGGMTNNAVGLAGPNGETWEYDGTNWVERVPARAPSPAPRHGPALFYDPVRRVTTLYGGDTLLANSRAGDIWVWDGTNWTAREVTGERPLFGGVYGSPFRPQMVWDDRHGYAVLPPQANNVPGGVNVTWTWDGTGWTARPTPFEGFGVSPPQSFPGMGLVYDRYRGEVIYWAGTGYDQDSVWRWTGSAWRRDALDLFVGFHIDAASAYDERRNSVVMFGGNYSGSEATNMVYRGNSARTFERLLADEPVVLRPPVVETDAGTGPLQIRVVAAGAPPLTYEWQRDGVKLLEAFPYAGTTNPVLRVERGLAASDSGLYRCVVRGRCGMVISRGTTLAGVLDRPGPVLSLISGPVMGQPGLALSWSGAGVVLERAPVPAGPWTAVAGATSPFTPALEGGSGFFRLRAP